MLSGFALIVWGEQEIPDYPHRVIGNDRNSFSLESKFQLVMNTITKHIANVEDCCESY